MEENKNNLVIRKEEYGLSIADNIDNMEIAKDTIQAIIRHDIVKADDKKFFLENVERWNEVSTKTHIWRTLSDKKSILSELPTTHLKLHQAILENKVFYEQTILLDKDAKLAKLDAEELYVDAEELKAEIDDLQSKLEIEELDSTEIRKIEHSIKKKDIKLRKKLTELHEKAISIKNLENQMLFRMDELKDWKILEDSMIEELRSQGLTDEEIWNKNTAQSSGNFFYHLTRYQAIDQSKDSGEINNLTYLAKFYVDEAIRDNKFEDFLRICSTVQINSLIKLGYIKVEERADKSGYEILIPNELKKRV